MKIGLKKMVLLFLTVTCFNNIKAATYGWTGAISSSWTNPLNWLNGVLPVTDYPGQNRNTDVAQFGVSALGLFVNQPVLTLTSGQSVTVAAVTFGPNQFINVTNLLFNGTTLTVNVGTLNVTGNITQNINSNAVTNSRINNFLLGTGTINCANIQVGSGSSTTTNFNFLFSEVKNLNVTNNVTVVMNTAKPNGCAFRLQAGSMAIGGQIGFTVASASVTSTNAGYFTIDGLNSSGVKSNPTLTLSNVNALGVAASLPQITTGINTGLNMATVNFDGTGTSGGKITVVYTAASPTVYTSSLKGFGPGGGTINTALSNYDNLIVNGTGTATIGLGTGAGVLKLDSTLTTSSNTTFANATTTTTIGTNWQNDAAATITGGAGTTTILKNLTNAGIMNMASGNITIGSNYTNDGTYTQAAAASDPTITSPVPTNTTYFTSASPVLTNTTSSDITTFNNLVFTGGATTAASLTGSGPFIVASKGILQLKTTGITLQTNGLLTLKSDVSSTAAVAFIPVGAAIAGFVNVERFLTGGGVTTNRGYRMLSSPVNQTSATSALTNTFGLTYLKDHTFNGITYTGAYTGGVAGTAAGFSITSVGPTVSIWDERKATNNTAYNAGRNIGVTKISPTNGVFVTATTNTIDLSDGTTNLALPVGNSFQLFFIGPSSRTNASASTPPADATITAHGYINQQNVTVALWHTPTGGVSGKLSYTAALGTTMAGINMVGNPYASTINLQTVLNDNTGNIDNIYVLAVKNYPSQAFIAYTPSGTSAPAQGYAVSGEGFFVHATGTGKSLTFNEGEKTPATQLTGTGLIMSAPKSGQMVANEPGAMSKSFKTLAVNTATQAIDAGLTGFYMKMEKDTAVYNYCGIYFGGQWSKNFQIGDARDLDGNSPQVMMSSFSADRVRCAVKHFPDYRQGVRIKLFANGKTDGMYSLKIEGIRNIDTNNYKITLLDHFKKDSLDIGRYKSYAFNISRSDTNTFGANRFELTVQQLPASKYQLPTFTAQKATDGVLLTWRAYNEGPNYFFTLEKQQTSGKDYSSVYHTQSNGGTIYKYTDKTPNTGDNVYRLKQVDLFGNITYAGPVNIYYDKSGNASMFSVYPNPTVETLNIAITNGKTTTAPSKYKLNIYDVTGSMVLQKTSDSTNWSESVSQFNPGIYIAELKDDSGNSLGKAKFVKK